MRWNFLRVQGLQQTHAVNGAGSAADADDKGRVPVHGPNVTVLSAHRNVWRLEATYCVTAIWNGPPEPSVVAAPALPVASLALSCAVSALASCVAGVVRGEIVKL
jgi:hypothetical protein